MSRFVHFFGEVYDKKAQDLGVDEPKSAPIDIYINPDQIEAIRENVDLDGEKSDGAVIYLKSGTNFWVEEEANDIIDRLLITVQYHERGAIK